MGNSSSTHHSMLAALYKKAYDKAAVMKTGGASISDQDFVALGGYSSLEEYGNSVYSEAKEKLIRGIASDVASLLKVKNGWATESSIKDVVEKLRDVVPDPKNNKTIKTNSEMHKQLCSKLAESINKRYDMNVIDVTADPTVICNGVSEIMYSLFTGLHSEFLTISGDVTRILRNLRVLREYIDGANKKLIDALNKNAEGTDSEAESIKSIYEVIKSEIVRQETILANLTGAVITPVGNSLITILEENDDFKGLTKDLEKLTGTAEFGDKLGFLLAGTASVAHAAEVVDKALKKIGMTVSDYKSTSGMKELREKITKKIEDISPTSIELYKFLAAADIIYKNDINHDDIVAHLEKKVGSMTKGSMTKGGANLNEYDVSFADSADIQTAVDNDDNPFKGRTQSTRKSISKQLDQKKQLRKQLFSTLNSQIKDRYDVIKYSLTKLSKKIGSEIELSPELDMFIRQLNYFSASQPDRYNIHIALSGFRKDIGSDFIKYQFMENLHAIVESAGALESSKGGATFKEIKDSVVDLISVIQRFNETFTNTLSDIHVESIGVKGGDCGCSGGDEDNDSLKEGVAEFTEEFLEDVGTMEGGSALSQALGGVVVFIPEHEFNHFKTMKKSIREIDYYYRIAGIKANMNKVSMEFENNTENYENILGEEAGWIIDKIQMKHNNLIKALDASSSDSSVKIEDLYAHGKTVSDESGLKRTIGEDIAVVAPNKELKDYEDGYKFLLEYVRASKIEMLEAAQALDLYLSKFTKSMQFKPDQIKEFVQILEQIEVVAKWFTDKSGDNLVGVFESFSTTQATDAAATAFPYTAINDATELKALNGGQSIDNLLDGSTYVVKGDHYYDHLGQREPAFTAGRFYNARMMTRDQAINFVKQIEKSIKSVRALENIIATFSRVNTNISAEVKTFMSSGSMFKAFMNYAIASVISVGYLAEEKTGDDVYKVKDNFLNPAAANPTSSERYQSLHAKMAVGLRFNKDTVMWKYDQRLDTAAVDAEKITNDLKTDLEKAAAAVDVADNVDAIAAQNALPGAITTSTNARNAANSGCIYLELCDPLSISTAKYTDPCDKIFEMSIKSLISKVFTIVGSYTLFNRPAKQQKNSLSLSTNPLRQILGGAPHIKIIPEATELYIRLPLLAEWYRTVFEFNESATPYVKNGTVENQSNPLISIIPDMDTIWGDLCKVIFLDARNIIDGAYPTDYANKIIEAISAIYTHYKTKYPNVSTREIIMEFVLEINRRYGFIMREEINSYLAEKHSYININETYPEDDNVEFNLVDIESNIGRRPAPSDKFRAFTKKETTRKFDINDLLKVVKRFRHSIDANLMLKKSMTDADFRTISNVSLGGVINETKKKIDTASSSEDKYNIIHEQLHGIEKFGDVDQQKLILFHETVVTPLTVLYFTYLILNDFNRFCTSLNPDGADTFDADTLLKVNKARFKGASNPYKTTTSAESMFENQNNQNNDYRGLIADGRFTSVVMETLLRKVMNIGCDMNNMTEINFIGTEPSGNYPYIIYDKLEETCSTLFNNAKSAFSQLRKFLPPSLVKRYESAMIGDTENRISLFYIQEHLFERLFDNKYGNGLVDANTGLKEIWQNLTKSDAIVSYNSVFTKIGIWKYTENMLLREISGNQETSKFPSKYITVFNTNNTFATPGDASEKKSASDVANKGIMKVDKNLYIKDVVLQGDPDANDIIDAFLGTNKLYDLADNVTNDNHKNFGLTCKINSLIYKYCTIFADPATGKIYKPLLDKFVSGHNAKDIMDAKNINDNIHSADSTALVTYTEPQEGAILFASLANALKNILYTKADKTFGIVDLHTEENFLKVNSYQKELMRTNLPVFEKELDLIIKKSEFLRRCLEETNVDVAADAAAERPGLQNSTVPKYTQANKIPQAMASKDRKIYLIGVFDDISMTAKSLKRCINDVQKELADVPMYFEVYQNSIVDYNEFNHKVPFMPISHITNLMNFSLHRKEENVYDLSLIPQPNMGTGSSQYKFTYGTRGLLHYQEPSMKYAPGVEALLTSYNEKMGGTASFDKTKMGTITEGTILLSRWVLDFMYHKQALDTCDWNAMRDLVVNNETRGVQDEPGKNNILNLSCQTGRNDTYKPTEWKSSTITMMVENDNHKQVMNRMITGLMNGSNNQLSGMERKDFRIFNILDLNIVPINVHAMQREIPFVNLFNYSFTFDHIVKNFIGSVTKDKSLDKVGEIPANDDKPEDTMVRNLIYPLRCRCMREYVKNTFRIMSGTTSFSLNRPKYLSDQLWNKVLLNNLYKDTDALDSPLSYNKEEVQINSEPFETQGINRAAIGTSDSLSYIKDRAVITKNTGNLNALTYEGYLRYNSKLVGWTEWFIQLQRVVRMLMRSQLEWISDPVVQGNDAISKDVTEYRDTNKFNLGDDFE
jgi:hypothetical protein